LCNSERGAVLSVVRHLPKFTLGHIFRRRSAEKSARWQLAVTPKDTVAGNFVPKLDFLGYYHATCNCLWNGIIVRQGTVRVGDHDLRFDSVCD